MAKCSNMNLRPFEVQIGEEILDDLRARLSRTRWPDEIADAGWGLEEVVFSEFHIQHPL